MVKKTMLTIKIVLIAAFVLLCLMPPAILNKGSYRVNGLNTFSSYEELVDFLGRKRYYGSHGYGGGFMYPEQLDVMQKETSLPDYSQTNIQVEGVDEADVIKTDGEYLYLISKQYLFVVKAYPPEEARIASKIAVNGTPSNLFINDGKLILFSE
ncbi:MAG: beta-propeller domain-containing protein, partial [Candidatus Bathyarchaeia archaeon]